MSELAVHSYVDPSSWLDEWLPRTRRTIGVVYDEKPIGPRFPDTDVPVPAELTVCASSPEEWFPTNRPPSGFALSACKFCWMLTECREYGLAHPELVGIWGGMNQKQRKEMSPKRRRL